MSIFAVVKLDIMEDKELEVSIKSYPVYLENPYTQELSKRIKTGKFRIAANRNITVTDHDTGLVSDGLNVIHKVVNVDNEQYVKLYKKQLAMLFDMSAKSLKLLSFIMSICNRNTDYVYFSYKDCMVFTGYKSRQVIYRALNELIQSNIIAKSGSQSKYWINPAIFFSGDRLVVVNEYRKIIKEENKSNSLLD